jgi:hypothetical protein
MRKIICTIKGKDYQLEYSSEIKKAHVEFRGKLHVDPPFEFKYIILNNTKEPTMFEPKDLDSVVCDRITQLILRDHNSVKK